jgi:hypothetical protein
MSKDYLKETLRMGFSIMETRYWTKTIRCLQSYYEKNNRLELLKIIAV